MTTTSQLVRNGKRIAKHRKIVTTGLKHCPQKRGTVQRVYIEKPKKPNSARRKCAKVKLSTGRIVGCFIPGEGHNLTKHSVVLIRGGRCQDLIGIRYRPIRGTFDLKCVAGRRSRLSKGGLPGISAVRHSNKSD